MKKPIQQVLLGAIALAATVTTSTAAISFTGTPVAENFDWIATDNPVGGTNPDYYNDISSNTATTWLGSGPSIAADWGQFNVAGGESTITDLAGLTAAVNSVSHANVVTFVTATNGPSTTTGGGGGNDYLSQSPLFRLNQTNQNMQIAFGGNAVDYAFLQARARNTSGSNILGVQVSFDLAMHTPAGSTDTSGIEFYYSADQNGAASTWNHIPALSGLSTGQISLATSQSYSATIDLSSLNGGLGLGTGSPNGNIFFRWAKDNATGNDNQFTVDNVTFTAVPEPSTGLLAASAAAALGFIRRRRK